VYPVLAHSLVTGNTTKCNDHPRNEWVEKEDYFLLDVSTSNHPNTFTKIDKGDFQKILWRQPKLRWHYHDSAPGFEWGKYVMDSKNKARLHRFVMGLKDPNLVIDHINGDTLDNRKCNLRVITRSENNKNMRKRINNTSGFQGVFLKDGLWAAKIELGGKVYYLGSFDSKEHANIAYKTAAKILGFSDRHGGR
jgi:hypothetical protein